MPMDRIGTRSFEDLVDKHSALHFMKRLAHLGPEGIPAAEELNRPSQKYVLCVSIHLSAVRSALAEGHSLASQVEIPPPESWLREMELDKDKYRQQSLDLFTIVVHSVLDRTLLLVNAVCDLGILERNCSLRNITRATANPEPSLAAPLSSLWNAVIPIADARNHFAHRGRHREEGTFSAVARAKVVTRSFDVPTDDVLFNDAGAVAELLRIMRSDLQSVSQPLIAVLDLLCAPFVSHLKSLGGTDLPTPDEMVRAEAVLSYFGGGEKPGFMS